jgi:hypothetical protein
MADFVFLAHEVSQAVLQPGDCPANNTGNESVA